MDTFLDLLDIIKYDFFKVTPPQLSIPNRLSLILHYDKENQVLWCDPDELPGFVATAKTEKEMLKEVYETLLIYFDVPRYFANKMDDYGQMTLPNGKQIQLSEVTINKDRLSYARA